MAMFNIDLVAHAFVVQDTIRIEANTLAEAMEIAINSAGERKWHYDGVDDESIEAYEERN